MRMWLLALIGSVTWSAVSWAQYCHSNDSIPYVLYSTKTSYELIKNDDSSPILIPGCEPIFFWMVVRHGTRYPPTQHVNLMKERLPKLRKAILQNHHDHRGTLCELGLKALANNGSLKIDESFDQALTATGREEILLLGRRFYGRFTNFFKRLALDRKYYYFRHIVGLSSQGSARSFSRGLFPNIDVQLSEAPPQDPVLQFSENCPTWELTVNKRKESDLEYRLFRRSSTFQDTIKDVTTRLGFAHHISTEDILLMYDICAYERAWTLEQTSSWCSAFTTDNLKVIEYAYDLQAYYKQGYGYPINYLQACPLLTDLIYRIMNMTRNETAFQQQEQPRGVFFFTEGEEVVRLSTLLGLAKDERPLTHNMTESIHRKWRTSLIGSFAANVAVVLYNCSGHYKVQVFAKEEAVHLNACQDILCTLSEFLNHYGPSVQDCTDGRPCNPNTGDLSLPSFFSVILAIIFNTFLSRLTH